MKTMAWLDSDEVVGRKPVTGKGCQCVYGCHFYSDASVVSMPRYRNVGKCGLNSEVCLIIVPVTIIDSVVSIIVSKSLHTHKSDEFN